MIELNRLQNILEEEKILETNIFSVFQNFFKSLCMVMG